MGVLGSFVAEIRRSGARCDAVLQAGRSECASPKLQWKLHRSLWIDLSLNGSVATDILHRAADALALSISTVARKLKYDPNDSFQVSITTRLGSCMVVSPTVTLPCRLSMPAAISHTKAASWHKVSQKYSGRNSQRLRFSAQKYQPRWQPPC